MHNIEIKSAAVCALLLFGCAGQIQTNTTYDDSADFAAYRTFAQAPAPTYATDMPGYSEITGRNIQEQIARNLQQKGLQPASWDDADLQVSFTLGGADMRSRGDDGHVIHISSMSAHRVPAGSGMYSATKFAVRALTEGLRQELRKMRSDIRVTALSPGYVETDFAEVYHGSSDAAEKTYGKFKVLQPEDVASTMIHVLHAPPHVAIHDVLMRPTRQPT